MTSWHYLPVYRKSVFGDDVLREYSICEAYLDKKGCLSAWTESSSIAPSGNTPEELVNDLRICLQILSDGNRLTLTD